MELECPRCRLAMERTCRGEVKYWACDCGGHVLGLASTRKMMPEDLWREVWPALRRAATAGQRDCPGCEQAMDVSVALAPFGGCPVDICDRCMLLWLDPDELAAMPKRDVPPELPLEERQAIGRAMAASIAAEYQAKTDSMESAASDVALRILMAVALGMQRRS